MSRAMPVNRRGMKVQAARFSYAPQPEGRGLKR